MKTSEVILIVLLTLSIIFVGLQWIFIKKQVSVTFAAIAILFLIISMIIYYS